MLNALFVIFGASLWATDTVFRHPLVNQFSPVTLVLVEHVIALFISFLLVIASKNLKRLSKTSSTELMGVAIIGSLGSAVATVLFTYSFSFVNPTVSILLQKIQPLIVITLSALFLGERMPKRFWAIASLALFSAFFLSFPHGIKINELKEADGKGAILALGAAFFWSISTIIGKALLSKSKPGKPIPSSVLSFWRFFFGLVGMCALFFMSPQARIEIAFIGVDPNVLRSITYMAIVPGFLGVTLYYRGLEKVPASVATVLELSFPLCALVINSAVLGLPLEKTQILATAGLLFSMILLSLTQRKDQLRSTLP